MAGKTEGKKKKEIKREFSAGGVVFRKFNLHGSKYIIKWLVTRSSPSKKYPLEVWRLPKGWIDDRKKGLLPGPLAGGKTKAKEEDLREAALREVEEEGGVKAKILFKIPTQKFIFNNSGILTLKFVTYYLMEYLEDSKEGFGTETEEIAWLEFNQAKNRLNYRGERKVLDLAKIVFEEGIQTNLL